MDEHDQVGITRDRLGLGVLLFATAAALILCWRVAAPFLPALTWAFALAIVAHPLFDWLESRTGKKELAAALAVLIVAVVLIAPIMLVTQQVVRQATPGESGAGLSQWKQALQKSPQLGPLLERLERHVNIEQEIAAFGARIRDRLTTFARGLVDAITQWLICLFSLFYFFRDRRQILTAARSYVPLSSREFDNLSERVSHVIHATVYGTVVVAVVQGALGALIFLFLGLSSPLLWGIAMALVAIVPVLGAFVVWLPAAGYLAIQGEWVKALILAGWGTFVISLIDNLLYPILVGKEMRLHTLLVFVALIGGLVVFGVSGIVLGPVVLAITLGLLDILRQRTIAGRPAEQPT